MLTLDFRSKIHIGPGLLTIYGQKYWLYLSSFGTPIGFTQWSLEGEIPWGGRVGRKWGWDGEGMGKERGRKGEGMGKEWGRNGEALCREWVGIGEGMGKSIEFWASSNLRLGLVQCEIGLLALYFIQKPNVQVDLISRLTLDFRSKIHIGPGLLTIYGQKYWLYLSSFGTPIGFIQWSLEGEIPWGG